MNKSLLAGATVGLFAFFALAMAIAALPAQQTALDGAHNHPYLETSIAQVRIEANSTNARQATQIAGIIAITQVLPSPTPFTITPFQTPVKTNTPTKTNTPSAIPPTPTQEDFRTPSNTPFPTFTANPTATSTQTPATTRPPFLDINFTCAVTTTDNLTKRATASPGSASLGTLPSSSTVTIAPYLGSIPYSTTSGLWYVPVVTQNASGIIDFDEIEYYILYARTTPPSEATPGVTPAITDTYLRSADPNVLCIPAIIRN